MRDFASQGLVSLLWLGPQGPQLGGAVRAPQAKPPPPLLSGASWGATLQSPRGSSYKGLHWNLGLDIVDVNLAGSNVLLC
jgi:hypothetical protein